jgi:hypothetical protein
MHRPTQPDLFGDVGCLGSTDTAGQHRADIAEYGRPKFVEQLLEVLVCDCQGQPVFARFRQDQREAVGREGLEFVGIEVEHAPFGGRHLTASSLPATTLTGRRPTSIVPRGVRLPAPNSGRICQLPQGAGVVRATGVLEDRRDQHDAESFRRRVLAHAEPNGRNKGRGACEGWAIHATRLFTAVIIGAPERYGLRNQLAGERIMTEFDFEARHKERSEAQTETLREQNEIRDLLNHQALKLADSIKKYAEPRYEIEVTVEQNEIVVTKKMTGVFLKINNNITISVDSQGAFAVRKGDYEKAKGANGQTGSLTEAEMIDAVADWLSME